MGRPKKGDEALTKMIGMRLSQEDLARLDALAAKLPLGSRHAFARLVLRVGLDAVERDPSLLLGDFNKKGAKR